MKKYSTPEMKIMSLELKDVITLSAEDLFAEFDDVVTAPDSWF